jgi:hypothetical protein
MLTSSPLATRKREIAEAYYRLRERAPSLSFNTAATHVASLYDVPLWYVLGAIAQARYEAARADNG